jgi:SWI/SNF-related matrix-associated actin-dependent regulator of chromatin subfamily A3
VVLGLHQSISTSGFESDKQEEILKSSDAVEFRKGGDAIKTLAKGEEELSKMPQAEQPKQLKSTLLPYQLQVCLEHMCLFNNLELISQSGTGLDAI